MAKRRTVPTGSTTMNLRPIRVGTARLINCSSFVHPDPIIYGDELLKPTVSLEVADGERRPTDTVFIFVVKAKIPGSKKDTEGSAWDLETVFFVVVEHDETTSNDEIERFTKATVAPLMLMRFVSVMETFAALGGIPIQLTASTGVTVEPTSVRVADAKKGSASSSS